MTNLIRMSTMDKETMKILLKILQSQMKVFPSESKEKLKRSASNILDKERLKELEFLLQKLEQGDETCDNFLVC